MRATPPCTVEGHLRRAGIGDGQFADLVKKPCRVGHGRIHKIVLPGQAFRSDRCHQTATTEIPGLPLVALHLLGHPAASHGERCKTVNLLGPKSHHRLGERVHLGASRAKKSGIGQAQRRPGQGCVHFDDTLDVIRRRIHILQHLNEARKERWGAGQFECPLTDLFQSGNRRHVRVSVPV